MRYNTKHRTSHLPFSVSFLKTSSDTKKLLSSARNLVFLYNPTGSNYTDKEVLLSAVHHTISLAREARGNDIVFVVDDLYGLNISSEDSIKLLQELLKYNIRIKCTNPKIDPTTFDLDNFMKDISSPNFLHLH